MWVLVAQRWPLKAGVTGNTHATWSGNKVLGDAVNHYTGQTHWELTCFWVLGGSSLIGDDFREGGLGS